MKYNVKTSALGSPEAGRVVWRSAPTCLVSFLHFSQHLLLVTVREVQG